MFEDPEVGSASTSLLTAIQTARSIIGSQPSVSFQNEAALTAQKQLEAQRAASQRKIAGLQSRVQQLTHERDAAEVALAALRSSVDATVRSDPSHEDGVKVAKLQGKVFALETQLQDTNATIEAQKAMIAQLESRLAEQLAKLQASETMLASVGADDQVTSLRDRINELTAEALRRERIIDTKTATIQRLQDELSRSQAHVAATEQLRDEAESKRAAAEMSAASVDAAVEAKTKFMERLNAELNEKRVRIDDLTRAVMEREREATAVAERHAATVMELTSNLTKTQSELRLTCASLSECQQKLRQSVEQAEQRERRLSRTQHVSAALASVTGASSIADAARRLRLNAFSAWRYFVQHRQTMRTRALLATVESTLAQTRSTHDADIRSIQGALRTKSNELAAAAEALQREQVTSAGLRQALRQAEDQVEHLSAELRALNATNVRLRIEGDTHAATLEHERALFATRLRQAEELAAQTHRELEGAMRHRDEQLQKLHDALAETRRSQSESHSAHERRLTAELEALQSAYTDERARAQALSDECDTLRQGATQSSGELAEQVRSLQAESHALRLAAHKSEAEAMQRHKEQTAEMQDTIDGLRRQVRLLEADNASLSAELHAVRSSGSAAQREFAVDAERLREALATEYRQQAAQLEAQLEEMRREADARVEEEHTKASEFINSLAAAYAASEATSGSHRARQGGETIQQLLVGLEAAHRREVSSLKSALKAASAAAAAAASSMPGSRFANRAAAVATLHRSSRLALGAKFLARWRLWAQDRRFDGIRASAESHIALLSKKRDELKDIAEKALSAARVAKKAARAEPTSSVVAAAVQVNTLQAVESPPRGAAIAHNQQTNSSLIEAARMQISAVSAELRNTRNREAELLRQVESLTTRNEALSTENSKLRHLSRSTLASGIVDDVEARPPSGLLEELSLIAGSRSDAPLASDPAAVVIAQILNRHLTDVEKLHLGLGGASGGASSSVSTPRQQQAAHRVVTREKEIRRI